VSLPLCASISTPPPLPLAHHTRRKKRKRKESADEPEAPSRASDRLRDRELVAPGKVPPGVEQGSELAVFIIDGECPK
jgi:hypothetical protein